MQKNTQTLKYEKLLCNQSNKKLIFRGNHFYVRPLVTKAQYFFEFYEVFYDLAVTRAGLKKGCAQNLIITNKLLFY